MGYTIIPLVACGLGSHSAQHRVTGFWLCSSSERCTRKMECLFAYWRNVYL